MNLITSFFQCLPWIIMLCCDQGISWALLPKVCLEHCTSNTSLIYGLSNLLPPHTLLLKKIIYSLKKEYGVLDRYAAVVLFCLTDFRDGPLVILKVTVWFQSSLTKFSESYNKKNCMTTTKLQICTCKTIKESLCEALKDFFLSLDTFVWKSHQHYVNVFQFMVNFNFKVCTSVIHEGYSFLQKMNWLLIHWCNPHHLAILPK